MSLTGQSPTAGPHALDSTPGVLFPERRGSGNHQSQPVIERRQFGNSHSELSEEARKLGLAIDQYKLVLQPVKKSFTGLPSCSLGQTV